MQQLFLSTWPKMTMMIRIKLSKSWNVIPCTIWSWYIALWSQEFWGKFIKGSLMGSGIFFTMFQGLGGFQGSLSNIVAGGRFVHVLVCLCLCFFCICVFVCFCVFGCSHSMRRKVAGTLCVCALNELTRTSMRALPQTSGPSFIQQSRKVSQFCRRGEQILS